MPRTSRATSVPPNTWGLSVADMYEKPYLDSSVFISWVKGEIIGDVDRGKVVQHILDLAEQGTFSIYVSALTLAEVHKLRQGPVTPGDGSEKIVEYFEHTFIKVVDVDRRIGEHANRLCREKNLLPNDAIHVACALRAGCDVLLAWDRGFSGVTEIRIEEPSLVGQSTLDLST